MSLLLKAIEVDSAAVPFYKSRGSGVVVENDGGSSESSSIGAAEESSLDDLSSSAVEGEEEEVESKMRRDSFCSLDSLEDSLPSKRGLSNYFNGKSKSFAALSDVVTAPLTAADLAKSENPFNKRRRILLANKARWPRHASCGCLSSVLATEEAASISPHQQHQHVENSASNLFSLEEDKEEEEDYDDENSDQEEETPQEGKEDSFRSPSSSISQLRKLNTRNNNHSSFRSPRSFSVGDLQQHHADKFL